MPYSCHRFVSLLHLIADMLCCTCFQYFEPAGCTCITFLQGKKARILSIAVLFTVLRRSEQG